MNDETAYLTPKLQVRRSFEQAAQHYDHAAVLQREVCNRMFERLDYIKHQPGTILDAGSGTGYGTRQLTARYPQARIVALDLALSMLQVARQHTPWWQRRLSFVASNRVNYVCADWERLPLPANSVEMIWSNLTLQWCDLERSVKEAQRVLKTGGLFMFSTFGPDTLQELRNAFHGLDGHTHVNRFIDMHDVGDCLSHGGFADPVMDMEKITMTYPDVATLLSDLKAIGAHNVTQGRRPGLMGKTAWRSMLQRYEALRNNGKLPATYEVVYGHAWKAQPRALEDGRQIIEFRPGGSTLGVRPAGSTLGVGQARR